MTVTILQGDCLEVLRAMPEGSVHCCVTSPPYWGLRDYGMDGQIGREETPEEYVATMVMVFRAVRRVLRDDGTLWLNLGDSYAGSMKGIGADGHAYAGEKQASNKGSVGIFHERPPSAAVIGLKPKDLVGIPWRVAFALQADGWYLRSEIIWHKPNAMPESVEDRPTTAHERIFLLSKEPRYYYDHLIIKEDALEADGRLPGIVRDRIYDYDSKLRVTRPSKRRGDFAGKTQALPGREAFRAVVEKRNKRTVWEVPFQPFTGAHFAACPPKLIEPCVLAGCPPQGKRCDCDHIINTPVGDGISEDPTITTGRAGMNRPRRENEGRRPITKREQRDYAQQMKVSPHRIQMEIICGSAFDHYIRTDESGARPLPDDILRDFRQRGWLTEPPPCNHPIEPAGTVLDPFFGAGTTGLVADRLQRNCTGIEINPEYIDIAAKRIKEEGGMFTDIRTPSSPQETEHAQRA